MPLTDVRIRSLKPADKPHKYSDGGLFLFIPPSDSKLWRMAYRFEGKSRLLSFGAYPAVSLKDARERRDEARRLLAKGIDPSAYKRQQQEARRIAERDSFQNIAREWHATRMAAFSAKHQGTVMYRLRNYIFPFIGTTPIARLEVQDNGRAQAAGNETLLRNIPARPANHQSGFPLCRHYGASEAQHRRRSSGSPAPSPGNASCRCADAGKGRSAAPGHRCL